MKSNLKAEIVIKWEGGEHLFSLKCDQIEELEKSLGAGIGRIGLNVFGKVDYKYQELREVIRLGLIGGGMNPVDAERMVKVYVDNRPLMSGGEGNSNILDVAHLILQAAFFGIEDIPSVGEPESLPKKQISRSTGKRSLKQA